MMITSYVISAGIEGIQYSHWKGTSILQIIIDWHCCSSINSEFRQHVYSRRSISVEPLIEHMKDVFTIDPLPVRGFDKVRSIVLISILLYQLMVYYNYLTEDH